LTQGIGRLVDVGIDQSGNDGAPAGIEAAGRGPNHGFDRIVAADGHNPAFADGEGLRNRRCGIKRHDFRVRDDEIGLLGVSYRCPG